MLVIFTLYSYIPVLSWQTLLGKPFHSPSCLPRLSGQRPAGHGHMRRSEPRACAKGTGSWHLDWQRPPPHSGHQTGRWFLCSKKKEGSAVHFSRLPSLVVWIIACMPERLWIQITGDCRGHGAAQGCNSCHGNLLVAVLVWAGVSGGNHVGLEQGALQVDMVVGQGFVDGSQDLLGDVLATLQVVVTIRKNLRLNNGNDAVLRKAETKRVKGTMFVTNVA